MVNASDPSIENCFFHSYFFLYIVRVVRIRYACSQGPEEELLVEVMGGAVVWVNEFAALFALKVFAHLQVANRDQLFTGKLLLSYPTLTSSALCGHPPTVEISRSVADRYSTRAKRFVRCPFYTKSAHLHHPLSLRNVYENQPKLANP